MRAIIAFFILALTGASTMANEDQIALPGNGAVSLFSIQQNPSMRISVGKTYVTIKPDGTIVYGEGYTPDAAAKAFWDAIGLERKERKP